MDLHREAEQNGPLHIHDPHNHQRVPITMLWDHILPLSSWEIADARYQACEAHHWNVDELVEEVQMTQQNSGSSGRTDTAGQDNGKGQSGKR